MEFKEGRWGDGRDSFREIWQGYKPLPNVSFEEMLTRLRLKPPDTVLTVQDSTKDIFLNNNDERLAADFKSEELSLDVDHESLIWFGEGVKIGTLKLNLYHDSVAVIAPNAQIRIIKVRQSHHSLLIIGSGIHVVKGTMEFNCYLLHTVNTSVGLESVDHLSRVFKYGGNIYKPDLKSLRLTKQLSQLLDTRGNLEETTNRKARIIAELQGSSSKAK